MATRIFSEHFAKTAGDYSSAGAVVAATEDVATLTVGLKAGAGIAGARKRYKKAYIKLGLDFDIGDEARLMQFKSGDRIHAIYVSSDGGATAGAADLGLYKTGHAHDGAVIDADLFASALVLSTAIDRVDEFDEAATLDNFDRGKTLWECAEIGAGSYFADPFEDWDLVLTGTTAVTVAVNEVLVEVEYTAGD